MNLQSMTNGEMIRRYIYSDDPVVSELAQRLEHLSRIAPTRDGFKQHNAQHEAERGGQMRLFP